MTCDARKTLTILLLSLLLAIPTSLFAQPTLTFEVLEGSTQADSLKQGTMLKVTEWHITGSDTLSVWVERTTVQSEPSYEKAARADRVVWCYPNRYPHDEHLFPNSRLVLSVEVERQGATLLMFTSEETYRKFYANELGWEPVYTLH